MIHQTKGIILHTIKYRETSVIAQVYTEKFGFRSYIIKGARGKGKAQLKAAVLQPMYILEMSVYEKEHADIQQVGGLHISYIYQSFRYHPEKSMILIFMNEILTKILREEEPSVELFQFIESSLITFDTMEDNIFNFHLQFLLKIIPLLGFGVDNGLLLLEQINLANDEHKVIIRQLDLLIQSPYGVDIEMNNTQRRHILELILKFYQWNFDGLGDLKSLEVLKQLQ